jgi:hypothetical protein
VFCIGHDFQSCRKGWKENRALLMTAKLMSGSVCFEPISKSALYQGTTSVVPKRASRTRALAPAALFSLSVRLRAAFGRSTCEEDITFTAFNRWEAAFAPYSTFFRSLTPRGDSLPAGGIVGNQKRNALLLKGYLPTTPAFLWASDHV